MNICKMRNWLANYSIIIFKPDAIEVKYISEKETDIQSLIFWGFCAIFMTLTVYWWLIPIIGIYKYVLSPVLSKKYNCDN